MQPQARESILTNTEKSERKHSKEARVHTNTEKCKHESSYKRWKQAQA